MKRFLAPLVATALAIAALVPAYAAGPEKSADPRAAIAKKFPGVKADEIRPSPVSGIYEVPIGADTAYVSADGRYLIAGDLYEIDTRINVTEAGSSRTRRRPRRWAKPSW